jgi:hypothetical protein
VSNLDCTHHTIEAEKAESKCADPLSGNELDLDHCKDCCSLHTQIITNTSDVVISTNILREQTALTLSNKLYSKDLSSLNRPPIS